MTTPQTILITGATSGIGKHAAIHLAKRGHRVIGTGRRPEALERLTADARAEGASLETLSLDVTDERSIAAAAAEVDRLTDGRGLDVLINNAGFGQFGPIETLSQADLKDQFETNLFGLVATTQAFLPAMRERGAGRVINVSSVAGRVTFPFSGAYHASKYALEAVSDALRRELLLFGVDVVVIEPGVIATAFGDRALKEASPYRDPSSPYASLLERADSIKERSDRMAVGPLVISRAITRAVESRRPRARYIAPRSARWALRLAQMLPARLVDRLLLRAYGLRKDLMSRPASRPSPAAKAA